MTDVPAQFTPSPLRLHSFSSRLAKLLYKHYDIYTPEMNAAPVLWKAVRCVEGSRKSLNQVWKTLV